MGPKVEEVVGDDVAPSGTGVVVVGGGIIGVSAALFLAQRGVRTVLCEKGHIAGEQSSRNWGWVRRMGRDVRELPLITESQRIWDGLDRLVEADTGFVRSGILYLGATDKEMERYARWLDSAGDYRFDTRLIDARELATVLPGGTARWKGALHTPSDARAEPQKAAPAIARAARRLGATILTNCAVRGVETKGGRVEAVVTEKGRIACDGVLLAGGAWSSLFLGNLGIRLPQLKVLGSVMRTERLEGAPGSAALADGFAFRRRQDGGYTIADVGANVVDIVPDSFRFFGDFLPSLVSEWRNLSLRVGRRTFEEFRTPRRWSLDQTTPFERVRVLDPEPVVPYLDAVLGRLKRAYPAFGTARIAQRWAGLIDVTPDAVPVISRVDSLPGLVVATGFSGHGFGIGPGAGHLAADLLTGAPPIVDPTPFRLSRFSDGSRPRQTVGW